MKTTLGLLALLLLLAPRPAAAQGFISPFVGFDFGGDAKCADISSCEDKRSNIGVSFGKLGSIAGIEEEFAYAKDFFGEAPGLSSNVITLMTNVIVGPKIAIVRPYGVIGAGLIKTHVEFTPVGLLDSSNNGFGWNLGGGLIVGGRHIGVRGDIRYFHSFKDLELAGFSFGGDTKIDFGRATVGLFLGF
jgi:hypothetical protein